MHALHQEILPSSGVEFATSLKLLPSTLHELPTPPNATIRHELTARVLCNVVVARSNLLRIFEVREEPAPVSTTADDERERKGKTRRGTEAVEGEVEMDESGEGFINIAKSAQKSVKHPTITKLYFIREHRLYGTVTGLEGIRTISSFDDKLDRLLVSFKDAKIALLEWSDAVHDLTTVSIHTYERAPQLLSLDSPLFRADLRVDPHSRCAALSLPKHAIAILPFYQSQAELDVMDQDLNQPKDVPYSPSFILDLPVQVDENIRNVMDFVFLPGFNNPTIAILFQPQQTWTGRLREFKDTVRLIIFTLDTLTQHSTIITSVEGLPHDAFSLLPCSTTFGGVMIITSDSIVYVDQSSRRVGLPINGWANRISDLAYPTITEEDSSKGVVLCLEGCRALMVDEKTMFIVLKDGIVYPIELITDGKTVSRLNMANALAQTTIPSVIKRVDQENIFIGSAVGPSVLVKAVYVEEEVVENEDGNGNGNGVGDGVEGGARVTEDVMDVDDDDDIYGDSKMKTEPTENGGVTHHIKKTKTVLHLSLRDYLPAYGPISSMTFSLAMHGEKPVPELVAATGSGHLGGFTLFQRDLPIRRKRKILAISGSRGIWSLPIRQPFRSSGMSTQSDTDTLILSTDINPSPGSSRIAVRSPNRDVSITNRIPGLTIGASTFFNRTAILHVMTSAIRVLEPDGSERQTIPDKDGNMPRPKIRACSISDPFVLVLREDDSIGLFIGEVERGRIRRKDMSPMGDKTSRYLAGCFYTDSTGIFENQFENPSQTANATTSTLQAASGAKSQWLLLVRPQGVLEIWTLPKLALAFSTTAISSLQSTFSDSFESVAVSLPQDPPRKPQELDIEQVLLAPIGESSPTPHLCVFLRSGQLTIYQVLPLISNSNSNSNSKNGTDPSSSSSTRQTTLKIKFVKVASKSFDIQRPSEESDSHHNSNSNSNSNSNNPSSNNSNNPNSQNPNNKQKTKSHSNILAEQKKVVRQFIPFTTSPAPGIFYSGVFFTGDKPHWILSMDRCGLMVYSSGHNVVNAFTSCSIWCEDDRGKSDGYGYGYGRDGRDGYGRGEGKDGRDGLYGRGEGYGRGRGDFLMYTEEGPVLIEWIPDFQFNTTLPTKSVPRGRNYSSVVFDASTSLIVASSSLQARFASFDEDGNKLWEPDAPNITEPLADCSALELIAPDIWVTMDGYEFATNEYINDMAIVTLETAATESGTKDFIAVGTTIDRGEDLAVKGATYIFEIAEVVPDQAVSQRRWYKLRLRCRDEAKGPVTAVCALNDYLVSSMGQKIFVRAFDSDERLVGVAFLDVGVYVTSLESLKNLLLIGDAVKSVSFVAFQEDPYKLVLLSKDTQSVCVTRADFLFSEHDLRIVTGDEDGIIRIYEYDPQDPDSRDGKHLILRTEFHGQREYRTSALVAHRTKNDPDIPQARLITGSADGSLTSLTLVDEPAFKRLLLLQGQLTRSLQHVAALNPKAFRIVRNEYVSKPFTKGILDGHLLSQYEGLPINKQHEVTQQIGTENSKVLKDWIELRGSW